MKPPQKVKAQANCLDSAGLALLKISRKFPLKLINIPNPSKS
jgi:hypothetical protein